LEDSLRAEIAALDKADADKAALKDKQLDDIVKNELVALDQANADQAAAGVVALELNTESRLDRVTALCRDHTSACSLNELIHVRNWMGDHSH
jgi:hypothetical protein